MRLLFNADLESSQRASILRATVSNVRATRDGTPPSTEKLLEEVKYVSIAAVFRQYERKDQGGFMYCENDLLSANRARGANENHDRNQRINRSRSQEHIAEMKKTFPCHTCNRYCNCAQEHKPDGSLSFEVKAYERSTNGNKNRNQPENSMKAVPNAKSLLLASISSSRLRGRKFFNETTLPMCVPNMKMVNELLMMLFIALSERRNYSCSIFESRLSPVN